MKVGVRELLGVSGMLLTGWATGCGNSSPSPSPNEPSLPPAGGSNSSGSGGQPQCGIDEDGDGHCQHWGNGGDCDDGDPDVHPGATEAANAIDDNCDGVFDEGVNAACPLTLEMPDGGCETATELAAGASHACVLTDAGRVLCWGKNVGGALGLPDLANSPVPLAVPGVEAATELAITGSANCALVGDRAICWGGGSTYPFNVPLPPLTTQIAIAYTKDPGGSLHFYLYALDSDGAFHQRAFFARPDAPAAEMVIGTEFVEAGTGMKRLVAGGGPMCAITSDDGLVCFNEGPPTEIAPAVVDFAVMGVDQELCYKTAGELYCGTTTGPGAMVAGNGSAIGAATSNKLRCAFNAAGKVGCWAGGGPTTIADASALAVGGLFGCILRTSGKVSCFGNDDGGTLGDGRAKPSIQEAEPVDVLAAPAIDTPAPVLLGTPPLGACDSLADLSTLVTYLPRAHAAVAACKEQCATLLDSETCFASCAKVPGITPPCLGCYTALATCTGADCYQKFVSCAGYAVDFVQAVSNAPRFECVGAKCLRGASLGQPCSAGADCLSGSCSKLPQAGDALACVIADGAFCYEDSPYCACKLGMDFLGPTSYGYCGGCYGEGRIASAQGDCLRDCTQESFCVAEQMCRNFSSGKSRYCE